ncbi:hypothetical protein HK101_005583, partial [Irineochytrium annulatum]
PRWIAALFPAAFDESARDLIEHRDSLPSMPASAAAVCWDPNGTAQHPLIDIAPHDVPELPDAPPYASPADSASSRESLDSNSDSEASLPTATISPASAPQSAFMRRASAPPLPATATTRRRRVRFRDPLASVRNITLRFDHPIMRARRREAADAANAEAALAGEGEGECGAGSGARTGTLRFSIVMGEDVSEARYKALQMEEEKGTEDGRNRLSSSSSSSKGGWVAAIERIGRKLRWGARKEKDIDNGGVNRQALMDVTATTARRQSWDGGDATEAEGRIWADEGFEQEDVATGVDLEEKKGAVVNELVSTMAGRASPDCIPKKNGGSGKPRR